MTIFFRILLPVLLALSIAACGRPAAPAATSVPAVTEVTIDGNDSTGIVVDPINVWASYQPRGRVVARVHHGDKVDMIRRDGDGVLIRTADGTEGWVTYFFVRELK